jgi:hypothetical protein
MSEQPSVAALKAIYDEYSTGNIWIRSVPHEVSEAFFDNPYANSQDNLIHKLIRLHFGELFLEVEWLMYEWEAGLEVGNGDGVHHEINTPEDYYEYLIKYENWRD